jgi:hypothetical protein
METTILITKIFSILFLAMGIAGLINKNYYQELIKDMFKNRSITFLMGLMTIIGSFLIVTYHNIWVKSWVTIITVFGWMGLVKGIIILLFPGVMERLSTPLFEKLNKILPYTTIIIGLLLGYLGFF